MVRSRLRLVLPVVISIVMVDSKFVTREVQFLEAKANPIRRVVSLLQGLSVKITKEGEAEKALFDDFMCYCKKARAEIGKSIADELDKAPEVESDIKEAESRLKKSRLQLARHEEDTQEVTRGMQAAAKERASGLSENSNEIADLKKYLSSISSAIQAIQSGRESLLLQSSAKDALLNIVEGDLHLKDYDRNALTAFLSGSGLYIPKSTDVVCILKEMQAGAEKNLQDLEIQESDQQTNSNDLLTAKKQAGEDSQSVTWERERTGRRAWCVPCEHEGRFHGNSARSQS
jgi:hypothetical protein